MSNITMMMVVYAIFIFFLLCSPSSIAVTVLRRLQLPSPLTGPDSLAFDRNGAGPYTGASDGRILKYFPNDGFKEYAYTSPTRNKTCDGLADFSALQATCGRPLGLSFNHQTGELYAADAYFGLVKIGPNGGTPTQLVGTVQGTPLKFAAALDIDPDTGIVYFTEASSNYQIRDYQTMIDKRDSSGSLFKYDPSTNHTTVLLRGLAVASGVAISRDGSFLLVSELVANRVRRFWLKGPRTNQSELFWQLAGRPENIKRNSRGQFWVAVNSYIGPSPPQRVLIIPAAIRVNENGLIVQVVNLMQEYGSEGISEVQEFNGTLYAGSLKVSYASIFTQP
ncbi:hypothetical protein TanjilG_18499 [Lupinus angustifolius]|uniref:Strictosidine synthase conserved region domain-containing protein n=1 Tax=Lupinus angustifolius TaxID=3871 RepID=A0A4P1RX79_LUPAN|nr:PREDICTED: protein STRICTOSIDINE SYNTHASE-LIKE 12-like [Lupinus angustifolius]OIW19689.1 hypothetical protein TanjilG_18499 [Lupinus angustifolius]